MIMLDRNIEVIGGNRAAQLLLDRRDGLLMLDARLVSGNPDDTTKLHSILRHAMIGIAEASSAPVLAVRRDGRRPLMVTIVRVGAAPRGGETAIVLQVIDPDLDRGFATAAICAMFGMTGAETRLATLLAAGHSLTDAAATLRVQLPTARAYLTRAFEKTSTNRQAALVHLLLSSASHPAPGTELRSV